MSKKIPIEELKKNKYGKLVILYEVENLGRRKFRCKCECGNEKNITLNHLQSGYTRSCGCYRDEQIKKKLQKSGDRKSKLYARWKTMKQRCFNPKNPNFKNYGFRGITICDEWRDDYKKFEDWAIENGYKQELEIDRIDNEKGYSPENCRFVSSKENGRNRRNTAKINGVPMAELIENNLEKRTIVDDYYRAKAHYPELKLEEAIKKLQNKKREHILVEGKTLKEISSEKKINETCLYYRYSTLNKTAETIMIKDLLEKKDSSKLLTVDGFSLSKISKEYNIKINTLRTRYNSFTKKNNRLPSNDDLINFKKTKSGSDFKVFTADGRNLQEVCKETGLSLGGVVKRMKKLKEKFGRVPTSEEIKNYMSIPR